MLVAVVVGSLAGESVGFLLGRWFGHRIRRSKLGTRLGESNWLRAERYLERRGGFAVFASRFLPVLHSLVPLTVGMTTMELPALHGVDGAGLPDLGDRLRHRRDARRRRLPSDLRRSCTGPATSSGRS